MSSYIYFSKHCLTPLPSFPASISFYITQPKSKYPSTSPEQHRLFHFFSISFTVLTIPLFPHRSNSYFRYPSNQLPNHLFLPPLSLVGLQYFSPKTVNFLNHFLSYSYPSVLHNTAICIDSIHTTQYC